MKIKELKMKKSYKLIEIHLHLRNDLQLFNGILTE